MILITKNKIKYTYIYAPTNVYHVLAPSQKAHTGLLLYSLCLGTGEFQLKNVIKHIINENRLMW